MEDQDLSPLQKQAQRISRETKKNQKGLKVLSESVHYEMNGNKIVRKFKKTNGCSYSTFVGFKERKEKESGRMVHTPEFLDLKKKGLLK